MAPHAGRFFDLDRLRQADSEDRYYLLNPATCESTAVTWVPAGAVLADARFRVALEDPAPARLLAYDPTAAEATLKVEHNYLVKVNRNGQVTFGPFRPKPATATSLEAIFCIREAGPSTVDTRRMTAASVGNSVPVPAISTCRVMLGD